MREQSESSLCFVIPFFCIWCAWVYHLGVSALGAWSSPPCKTVPQSLCARSPGFTEQRGIHPAKSCSPR